MPTLTRLAAMVLFGTMAYHLTELYYTSHALQRRTQFATLVMVVFAALVGWRLVGPKIERSVLLAVGLVFQGMGSTLLWAFTFSGLVAIFTNPSHKRYNTLEQALSLLASDFWRHLDRIFMTEFVFRLGTWGAVISLILVVIFRFAEARRLER
jgi:hypothetical protein